MHPRLVLVSVVAPLLVITALLAGARWLDDEAAADSRSSLTAALDTLPADTQVAGFTDWAQVRDRLRLGSASTAAARAALTDDAALRDLSTRSVLSRQTEDMHDAYGWSVADLDWEVYGQANDGAAMVGRLDGSVSTGSVRARLDELGYTESDGIWSLAEEGRAAVGTELADTLGTIALVPRQRLVVAGDRPAYVQTVVETIDRAAPSLLTQRSAADVASTLVGADSALLQNGPFVCASTSLDDAEDVVRAQAGAAVQRAGALQDPTFAGRAIDGGTQTADVMRFALGFESPTVATSQLEVRTALTSGPFIGGTGRLEDALELRGGSVHGSTAVLRFGHDPDATGFMTGDGPLLFAGCAP
jgi:hypothetical protein